MGELKKIFTLEELCEYVMKTQETINVLEASTGYKKRYPIKERIILYYSCYRVGVTPCDINIKINRKSAILTNITNTSSIYLKYGKWCNYYLFMDLQPFLSVSVFYYTVDSYMNYINIQARKIQKAWRQYQQKRNNAVWSIQEWWYFLPCNIKKRAISSYEECF